MVRIKKINNNKIHSNRKMIKILNRMMSKMKNKRKNNRSRKLVIKIILRKSVIRKISVMLSNCTIVRKSLCYCRLI